MSATEVLNLENANVDNKPQFPNQVCGNQVISLDQNDILYQSGQFQAKSILKNHKLAGGQLRMVFYQERIFCVDKGNMLFFFKLSDNGFARFLYQIKELSLSFKFFPRVGTIGRSFRSGGISYLGITNGIDNLRNPGECKCDTYSTIAFINPVNCITSNIIYTHRLQFFYEPSSMLYDLCPDTGLLTQRRLTRAVRDENKLIIQETNLGYLFGHRVYNGRLLGKFYFMDNIYDYYDRYLVIIVYMDLNHGLDKLKADFVDEDISYNEWFRLIECECKTPKHSKTGWVIKVLDMAVDCQVIDQCVIETRHQLLHPWSGMITIDGESRNKFYFNPYKNMLIKQVQQSNINKLTFSPSKQAIDFIRNSLESLACLPRVLIDEIIFGYLFNKLLL